MNAVALYGKPHFVMMIEGLLYVRRCCMIQIKIEQPASKGIVVSKAFIAIREALEADTRIVAEQEKPEEINRFYQARDSVLEELEKLAQDNAIFAAHMEVASDIMLEDSVKGKITDENKNAEVALEESRDEISAVFEAIEDEYLRERASDVKDVCNRIFGKLKGMTENPFASIQEEVIVIAKDLSPSDTANMNFDYVKGFITEEGGITSHVAIMARGMGLPAIVGASGILDQIKYGDEVILDAVDGIILIEPQQKEKEYYLEKAAAYAAKKLEMEKENHLPAQTKDGRILELYANVGSLTDVTYAAKHGAEGIGLFRSEFLYMENSHFPTEEEQFEAYKKAVETIQKPMVIRTLDIGGDKELSYYQFEQEENPFLGWRAIRISLDMNDIFKTQLRAILRASAFGKIKIMFPMIISVEEFRKAIQVLEECKNELKEQGISFDAAIETGIMIETPAAVICAEELAKEVDFFSIGTNDLTQYILAVDRGNKKIAQLYQSFHPAVLRSIRHVIQAGRKHGKLVAMCGEFASNEDAVPILLGMGLDEFSMAAGSIADVRHILRNLTYEDAKEYADKICSLGTTDDVLKEIKKYQKK